MHASSSVCVWRERGGDKAFADSCIPPNYTFIQFIHVNIRVQQHVVYEHTERLRSQTGVSSGNQAFTTRSTVLHPSCRIKRGLCTT